MAKRAKIIRVKKDQRMFSRTARKTKKINLIPQNTRGGGCL